jgi:hypothetical protein
VTKARVFIASKMIGRLIQLAAMQAGALVVTTLSALLASMVKKNAAL